MPLLFTTVELLNTSTAGLKEQKIGLPVFSNGDSKEGFLEIHQERRTNDFVFLGMPNLNGYSFTKEDGEQKQEAEGSSETSSIGVQSSSSVEEDEERGNEVQSKLKKELVLSSFDSLEDALPIKRGLSNFFTGKSKSFASLSEAATGTVRDFAKQENPFNKRRRILLANKISWGRRASYSSLIKPFPSLLSPDSELREGEEEEEDEDENEEEGSSLPPLTKALRHGRGRGLASTFRSPRSFSLSDLQHA